MTGDERHAAARGHDAAVLAAEARRLEHALAPFPALSREELARRVNAHLWHEGRFDAALRLAIRRGAIRELPGQMLAPRARRPGARRLSVVSPRPSVNSAVVPSDGQRLGER